MNEGVGTPTTYTECFEWFMAPYPVGGVPAQGDASKAPDVVNNSWGCPTNEGCDAAAVTLMQAVVNNVRAAGILVVASAGNTGPACGTVDSPPGYLRCHADRRRHRQLRQHRQLQQPRPGGFHRAAQAGCLRPWRQCTLQLRGGQPTRPCKAPVWPPRTSPGWLPCCSHRPRPWKARSTC